MKTRSIKSWLIIVLLTAYIVLYKFFIFQNYMKYSEIVSASFLMFLLVLSIGLLGFRKDKITILTKNVFKVVLLYLILAFLVMYGLGIFVGFLKNAYSLDALSLFNNIFIPIVVIILVELIRYVVIGANKDKKSVIIIVTILLTIFELFTSIRAIDLNDLAATFNITATIKP